jgi:hypothetical protein
MKFRGGEFSIGTKGNIQLELTLIITPPEWRLVTTTPQTAGRHGF